MVVSQTTNANRILDAQRLHARIYLDRKYIKPNEVSGDGRIAASVDRYRNQSDYFVLVDATDPKGKILATARQIHAVHGQGHRSFPTVKQLKLYPEMNQLIRSIEPDKIVEISALAKEHGVDPRSIMLLYRAMWHHSLRRRHSIWLMACDAGVFSRLKELFGDAFIRIGDNSYYMGSEVVPAMLEVHRSIDDLVLQSRRSLNPFERQLKGSLVSFFMTGLPLKYHQRPGKRPASRIIIESLEGNNS